MVADLNGYLWVGIYNPPDEGGNEFDSEWFQKGKNEMYLGDISYNPTMFQTTQIAAMPIKDANGKSIGVLQLETNVRTINEIISGRVIFGEEKNVYLTNKKGDLLSGRNVKPDAPLNKNIINNGIKKAIDENQDITMTYEDAEGILVIGSVQPFGSSLSIKNPEIEGLVRNLNWIIVGEVPKSKVDSEAKKLQIPFLILSIFVFIFSLGFGYFVSSRLNYLTNKNSFRGKK